MYSTKTGQLSSCRNHLGLVNHQRSLGLGARSQDILLENHHHLDQRFRNTLNRVSSRRFWVHHVGTQQDKIFKLLKALEIWKIRFSQGHSLLNSKQLDKSNPRGVRLLCWIVIIIRSHFRARNLPNNWLSSNRVLHSAFDMLFHEMKAFWVKRVQECHSTRRRSRQCLNFKPKPAQFVQRSYEDLKSGTECT